MAIENGEKFALKLDITSKTLFAEVWGEFGPTDAGDFLKEYTTLLKTIKSKEYILMFDCKDLTVTRKNTQSGVDMTNLLKGCIMQYKKDDFKQVTFSCGKNIIIKMQLGRLSREVGLLNCKVI